MSFLGRGFETKNILLCSLLGKVVDADLFYEYIKENRCRYFTYYNGCGNCPYALDIEVTISETDKQIHVEAHGSKTTIKKR